MGGQAGGEPERGGGWGGASCPVGRPAGPQAARAALSRTASPSFQDKHDPALAPPWEGQGAHGTARSTRLPGLSRPQVPHASCALCPQPPLQVCAGPSAHWGPRLPASPPGPGPREDSTGILQSQVLTAFERTGRAR